MITSAPTGLVTLVFTDVEGSTALWEVVTDAMREALAVHDRVMRETLAARRGYEVKTEGDAFMVTFEHPADALMWCLDAQETLLDAAWPPDLLARPEAAEVPGPAGPLRRGLRVRMGLHTGEPDCRPDPVTGRMDYFGPVVNRAARVGGAAHGGQVLVSGAARDACAAAGALASLVVQDLGEHGLKGLSTPERLVLVSSERLAPRRFPPVRTLDVRRTNLPPERTSFFGREEELEFLDASLDGGARLLTLLGPGGMGKTRLARALGHRAVQRAPWNRGGGVWFVDLTACEDPDAVTAHVGEVLGVGLAHGDPVAQVGLALASRGPVLLVLDNLEQVVEEAAPMITAWLEAAPALAVVATSRVPLEVPEEQVVDLSPLGVEDGVALFADRAAAARRGWSLDEDQRADVEALVTRLDALPLAIELAASRIRTLSVRKLLEKLGASLDVLAARGRNPRQATLRGAIDWSWRLLDPAVQEAAGGCAVFRGGFDPEAADAVLGESGPEVVDELLRHSFLRMEEVDGEVRYFLYEAIRQYLRERLQEAGARPDFHARHREYYVQVGEERAGELLDSARTRGALAWLSAERDNLLAAAARAREESPDQAARAVLALDGLLKLRGPAPQHGELFRASYRLHHTLGDPRLAARICLIHARLASAQGEADEAALALEAGRAAAARSGSWELDHVASESEGMAACYRGEYPRAVAAFERARGLAREYGCPAREARAEWHLAFAANGSNRAEDHLDHAEAARELSRRHAVHVPELDLSLGEAYLSVGRLEEAAEALRRAADEAARMGDDFQRTSALRLLGVLELEREDTAAARACLTQALKVSRRLGTTPHTAFVQRLLALVDVLDGLPVDAGERCLEGQGLLTGMGFWQLEVPLVLYRGVARHLAGDPEGAAAALAESAALLEGNQDAWQARLHEILEAGIEGREVTSMEGESSYNLRHGRRVAALLAGS